MAPFLRIENLEETKRQEAIFDLPEDDRQILDVMLYLDSKIYQRALNYVDKVTIKNLQRAIELRRLIEKRLGRKLNTRMGLFT